MNKIWEFIAGEVQRQGHIPKTPDYDARVAWMYGAWMWSLQQRLFRETITRNDILFWGHAIEPRLNNLDRYRLSGVQVGGEIKPPPSDVPRLMTNFIENLKGKVYGDADQAYLAFESIHPFVDGNGRVGKILHNWLNNTLANPVLIKDYFGHGNP